MAAGHANHPGAHGHAIDRHRHTLLPVPTLRQSTRNGSERNRHCNEHIVLISMALHHYLPAHLPAKDQKGNPVPWVGDLAPMEAIFDDIAADGCNGLRVMVGL